MPFRTVGPIQPIQHLPEQEFIEEPSIGQELGAAFRVENSLGSAFATGINSFQPLEGYNPFDEITGYEQFADSFIGADSPEETAFIKSQVDRELKDREILAAGGKSAFVAQIAAGVTDPIYLPLLLIPGSHLVKTGAGAVKTAGKVGVVSGIAESGAELSKHGTQEVRSGQESAFNIAGATLLSGVLGGAAHLLTRKEFDHLADMIDADGMPLSVGAARTQEHTLEELELSSVGGLEKIPVSPLVRAHNSPVKATRGIVSRMMESPLIQKLHEKGETAAPLTGAVETRIKGWNAHLASSLQQSRKHYLSYRQNKGTLSHEEFRIEVGKALRRGDVHAIPEVEKAYRKILFEPLKNQAIEAGLLPPGVKVKTAVSYLTRLYNGKKIQIGRTEWDGILTGWIKGVRQEARRTKPKSAEANIENHEIKGLINDITDHILSSPVGRIQYESVPLARGPLRERTFNIPDILIEDFLESDIEIVAREYNRTMAPDVELAMEFGDVRMEEELASIARDYEPLIAKAKGNKAIDKLHKRLKRDLDDVAAMRDLLRGTYKVPTDPDQFFVRASRILRDVNFIRLLGGMVISAVTDLARPIAVNGLKPVYRGLKALALAPKEFKLSRVEAKRSAAGLDMVLNSRAMSVSSLDGIYARDSGFERTLSRSTSVFGKVSLMTQWNAALKQFTGVITADRLLESAIKSSNGNISKTNLKRLAQSGIGNDMARRIAKQFQRYGDDGSIKLINGSKWDDKEALQALRSAVLKDVDRAIVTPGLGEKPLWTSSQMGKLAFQFKSFAASAHHKILLADLQYRDASALTGLLLSVALGTLSYSLKQLVAGREIKTDPTGLIIESLDRSGVFGYFWDVNNTLEKITLGELGVNPLLGANPMSRYATRNIAGAVLGPSADMLEDVANVIGATATGDFKASDIRSMRKLLPYQNLFYTRRLLNALEDKAKEAVE